MYHLEPEENDNDIKAELTALTILGILIPPLGVLIKRGFSLCFIISILLTFLGYIPGVIWAIYVIHRK